MASMPRPAQNPAWVLALCVAAHTLLSIEAVRRRDIPLHGVAFIGDANEESESIIAEIGKVKRLGRLPVIEPLTPGRLAAVFGKTFDAADFT